MNNQTNKKQVVINQKFFINSNVEDYVYYKDDFKNYKTLSDCFVIEKKDNKDFYKSEEFIEHYFNVSEKNIPDNLTLKKLSDKKRIDHSLYVYFVGTILIKNEIFKNIEKIIEKEDDVLYYWFLIAMFHDFGYMIELDSIKYILNKSNSFYPLKYNLKTYPIEYNLFEHKFISGNYEINSIEKCSLYSPNTFKQYYKYRIEQMFSLDHGILGGLLLYDFLCKNYFNRRNTAENKIKNKDNNEEIFEWNKRTFQKTDFDIYAYCSYAIAQHNIYRSDNGTTSVKYLAYGLDELIGTDKKFNKNKNPFSFLLGLVDTIEVTKRDINFEDINIVFNKKQNRIEFIFEDMIDKKEDKENHLKTIKDLSNWLDVDTKLDKQNNSVTIEIL